MERAKDYSSSSKKESDTAKNNKVKNTTDAISSTGKPTAVWQSPEFEEFDLCMEVTAYIQHWD